MRMCVKGQGEEEREVGKKVRTVFNFLYMYVANANLFSSIGKSEKYSHWIV